MYDERIMRLNSETEKQTGVTVSKLHPARILARTRNSLYEFTVIEGHRCWVKGGKHFPEFVEALFQGSSWDGSTSLKLHWIGYDMQMEIIRGNRMVRTTPVESVSVHGPDWSYTLDWPSK